MVQVTAVVTTGIYCRPGCGAKPLEDNKRYLAVPAAAQAAGYRACLRCRPYRIPLTVPSSAPELVCRAVGLILDGFLDGSNEHELGRRLGLSGRHLRRLFVDHLGVSPSGLARSARTHFARRLLDETDLQIIEIAFAAGFGSLRQFNRACRDVFGAPPSVLRAKRNKSDRLVADGGLALRLPFVGAVDWTAMARYFAAHATPGVEHVSGAVYRRTVTVAGDPGVLELAPGDGGHLIVRAHLPHWEELVHLVARARHIANLDRPEPRPPGTWDPFETGVSAIVGQHLDAPAAMAALGRLVARVGTAVPGLQQFGLTHTFPSPRTLASADLDDVGAPRAAAAGVRAFADAVVSGAVALDRSVSLDALIASMSELDGVDRLTAESLAFRLGSEAPAMHSQPLMEQGVR
jgi:AraC family transcriptional regulator of adaptative response / DNA-3-methyladenine glycosylase II